MVGTAAGQLSASPLAHHVTQQRPQIGARSRLFSASVVGCPAVPVAAPRRFRLQKNSDNSLWRRSQSLVARDQPQGSSTASLASHNSARSASLGVSSSQAEGILILEINEDRAQQLSSAGLLIEDPSGAQSQPQTSQAVHQEEAWIRRDVGQQEPALSSCQQHDAITGDCGSTASSAQAAQQNTADTWSSGSADASTNMPGEAEPEAKAQEHSGEHLHSSSQGQAGPSHTPTLAQRFAAVPWPKLWALVLCCIAYIHQATTGFALPAMLPMISTELHLSDFQGALLTTGYSYLYAVALVPLGLLADKMSRPKLLAGGLALWSVLTLVASTCRSFGDLMLARVGFAAAQGVQNPICFSLIPELFPASKATALALYNCAIYVGRALSFAAVLLARHLHDNDQEHIAARGGVRVETRLDQLDRADLHSLSIVHSKGDMAAAAPSHEFIFQPTEYGSEWWELPDSSWRQVLRWTAIPGLAIALAVWFTLPEPRVQPSSAPAPAQASTSAAATLLTAAASSTTSSSTDTHASKEATASVVAAPAEPSTGSSVLALLRSKGFMGTTLAAALNDLGSYALIAWQSIFLERVYHLDSSYYAPILAILLPVGGIIGGVGGGSLADKLAKKGQRAWVTGGATMLAAPFLLISCLAPTPTMSFAALLVGFALSEAWRAPAAVMARSAAPASLGSTASALYLCIRNLVGGLGPISIALLAERVGLQNAMLLIPAVYLASGVLFVFAERWYAVDMAEKAAGQLKQAAASALEAAKTVLPPARGLDAGKGAPGSGAAAAA